MSRRCKCLLAALLRLLFEPTLSLSPSKAETVKLASGCIVRGKAEGTCFALSWNFEVTREAAHVMSTLTTTLLIRQAPEQAPLSPSSEDDSLLYNSNPPGASNTKIRTLEVSFGEDEDKGEASASGAGRCLRDILASVSCVQQSPAEVRLILSWFGGRNKTAMVVE